MIPIEQKRKELIKFGNIAETEGFNLGVEMGKAEGKQEAQKELLNKFESMRRFTPSAENVMKWEYDGNWLSRDDVLEELKQSLSNHSRSQRSGSSDKVINKPIDAPRTYNPETRIEGEQCRPDFDKDTYWGWGGKLKINGKPFWSGKKKVKA